MPRRDRNPTIRRRPERTDPDGRFELKVAPGIEVEITATARPRNPVAAGANPNDVSVTVRGIRGGAEDVVICLPKLP